MKRIHALNHYCIHCKKAVIITRAPDGNGLFLRHLEPLCEDWKAHPYTCLPVDLSLDEVEKRLLAYEASN